MELDINYIVGIDEAWLQTYQSAPVMILDEKKTLTLKPMKVKKKDFPVQLLYNNNSVRNNFRNETLIT